MESCPADFDSARSDNYGRSFLQGPELALMITRVACSGGTHKGEVCPCSTIGYQKYESTRSLKYESCRIPCLVELAHTAAEFNKASSMSNLSARTVRRGR